MVQGCDCLGIQYGGQCLSLTVSANVFKQKSFLLLLEEQAGKDFFCENIHY